MKYYFGIIRPINLLLTAFTQVLFYLSSSRIHHGLAWYDWSNIRIPEAITTTLASIFVAAGGYVINDVFDIETDAINRPHKRIAARHISLKTARIYYIVLTAIGILLGFFTGLGMGILCIVIAVLLYFYSSDFKGEYIMGNLLVSLIAGMVVYIASRGVYQVSKAYFAEFASIAFFVTFAREIIKDVEDIEGDKAQEFETFAIQSGERKSKILAIFFLILAITTLIMVGFFAQQALYWAFLGLFIIPLVSFIIYKIIKASTKKDYRHVSHWLKLSMFLGLLSCLVS